MSVTLLLPTSCRPVVCASVRASAFIALRVWDVPFRFEAWLQCYQKTSKNLVDSKGDLCEWLCMRC